MKRKFHVRFREGGGLVTACLHSTFSSLMYLPSAICHLPCPTHFQHSFVRQQTAHCLVSAQELTKTRLRPVRMPLLSPLSLVPLDDNGLGQQDRAIISISRARGALNHPSMCRNRDFRLFHTSESVEWTLWLAPWLRQPQPNQLHPFGLKPHSGFANLHNR